MAASQGGHFREAELVADGNITMTIQELRAKIFIIVSAKDDPIVSQQPYVKAFDDLWQKETDKIMDLIQKYEEDKVG